MKKIVILLIVLTVAIANAISINLRKSSNINLTSVFKMFEANAEPGTCYRCEDTMSTTTIGTCNYPDPDVIPESYSFYYAVDCYEDENGGDDFSECESSGTRNCDGSVDWESDGCGLNI